MNARTTTDFNRAGLVKQRTAKKNAFLAVALSVIAATISFPCHAITFFTDRASWEAAIQTFADVNIAGQLANFQTLPAGNPLLLPFDETLTSNIVLERLQVPNSWATWSGGKTPAVLFTLGAESLTGTFGPLPVIAFGLEIEPNLFSTFKVSVTTKDGGTHTLNQGVNGDAGAKFFGWIGEVTSLQVACTGGCAGFAIGELVTGGFAGTQGKPNCHGQSVSALARQYGGMDAAAAALGFSSVSELQDAITDFCAA